MFNVLGSKSCVVFAAVCALVACAPAVEEEEGSSVSKETTATISASRKELISMQRRETSQHVWLLSQNVFAGEQQLSTTNYELDNLEEKAVAEMVTVDGTTTRRPAVCEGSRFERSVQGLSFSNLTGNCKRLRPFYALISDGENTEFEITEKLTLETNIATLQSFLPRGKVHKTTTYKVEWGAENKEGTLSRNGLSCSFKLNGPDIEFDIVDSACELDLAESYTIDQ